VVFFKKSNLKELIRNPKKLGFKGKFIIPLLKPKIVG
jgi:hypothetical protein